MNLTPTLSSFDAARIRWDVVVIGAGVAGTVASRELARRGLKVLLIDKRGFPRRKVCGACLNSSALQILEQLDLGSLVDSLGAIPLNQYTLRYGSRTVSLPLPGGRALSREVFDTALVAAAIDAGVDFLPETSASLGAIGIESRDVLLTDSGHELAICAKGIIVAAGLGGLNLAESSEWKTQVTQTSRIGAGCTIDDARGDYAAGTIWMAAGHEGYIGLVRVEGERLNIAAAVDRDLLRRCGSPAEASKQLLQGAGFSVPIGLENADWHGTVPLSRSTSPVASGRTFLIGDAAGYVEPFTGEGMTWAMLAGQRVVHWVEQAVRINDSSSATDGWCREYRRQILNRQRFCRVATRLIRSPFLVKIGIDALTLWPWIARPLMARMDATATNLTNSVSSSSWRR